MICSLLSYGAFLVACLAGVLFLIQERQLKGKRMGMLFHRLPSLEALDRLNFTAITFGFAFLTIGVGFGFVGARVMFGRWWTGDPKEVLTVALWTSYLVLWLVRLRCTLRGHRVALLSVLGFSLVLFAFVGTRWLLDSGHPYLRHPGAPPQHGT
jgi:ABC-type uncharacterized transport system permease subunit